MKSTCTPVHAYLHADDYAMNFPSSNRIFHCFSEGYLQGISIMPNGCLSDIIPALESKNLKLRIHLNLVEGKALAPKNQLDLLVDERGYFRHSFIGLLLLSLSPKRKRLKQQASLEFSYQIAHVMALTHSSCLGLDSHQHVHMIPLLFHSLEQAVTESGLTVESLRIPAEPLFPFLRYISLYPTYQFSNIIKNILLNFLFLFIRKDIQHMTDNTPSVFMGILFSGHMDEKRILAVLPDFIKIAQRRHTSLELLFHPGSILPGEPSLDPKKKSFLHFYKSSGRQVDAATLLSHPFYSKLSTMTHYKEGTYDL